MPGPGPSFRSSLLPMVIADDERRYVAVNPAACLLLRLPEEEVLRRRVDDLTPPEARGQMDEMWATFLREGTQRGTFELQMPDGPRLAVEFSATAHIEPGRHLSILMFPPPAADVGHDPGATGPTRSPWASAADRFGWTWATARTERPRFWGWTSRDEKRKIVPVSAGRVHGGRTGPDFDGFAADFDVVSISRDDEVIVALRGEVDLATAPLLERELACGAVQEAREVLVDLERVAFMDLTGLRPLLSFVLPSRPSQRVAITAGPPSVQRLLDVTGLRRHFHVVAPHNL